MRFENDAGKEWMTHIEENFSKYQYLLKWQWGHLYREMNRLFGRMTGGVAQRIVPDFFEVEVHDFADLICDTDNKHHSYLTLYYARNTNDLYVPYVIECTTGLLLDDLLQKPVCKNTSFIESVSMGVFQPPHNGEENIQAFRRGGEWDPDCQQLNSRCQFSMNDEYNPRALWGRAERLFDIMAEISKVNSDLYRRWEQHLEDAT